MIKFYLLLLLTTAAAMTAGGALAQSYPNKPIRWVVPFAPGGPLDVVARLIAQPLSESLGQAVVIDNRPGANGTLGSELVVNSAPDGYTLLTGSNATITVNPALYPKMVNLTRELVPITQFNESSFVLVTGSAFPAANLGEFLAAARKQPSLMSYASYGSGSSPHLAMEWLKRVASIDLIHIPYKGGAPALADLRGGHTTAMFDALATAVPQIQDGRLRLLATGSSKRLPQYPDIPALSETFPGFNATGWQGVFAPANTPRTIIDRLNVEFVKALQSPKVQQALISSGQLPVGNTPQQFAARIATDLAQNAQIVRDAGIKID